MTDETDVSCPVGTRVQLFLVALPEPLPGSHGPQFGLGCLEKLPHILSK